MNNFATRACADMEENLLRLHVRMPDMPLHSVMLSRMLHHVGRGMSTMLEHKIRPFGLNEAEFRVLSTLFSQHDYTANPTDLCAKTSQSPANMSRISDALVSRHLITRVSSVHDRRKMVLRITAQGEDLVRQLLPLMWIPLREIFRDLSEEQHRVLIGLLKEIGAKLDPALMHADGEASE